MSLAKKIDADFIQAMKNKEEVKKNVLSLLRSELKNEMINGGKRDGLDDADVIAVIKRGKKKLQDTAEQSKAAGRPELAAEAEGEIAVLNAYLPAEMSAAELGAIIEDVIKETGAMGAKDMGKVMKATIEKVAGRADSKAVSEAVKAKLA